MANEGKQTLAIVALKVEELTKSVREQEQLHLERLRHLEESLEKLAAQVRTIRH